MAGYGWSVEGVEHDWPAMIAAKEKELDRLHGIYMNLLKGAGNTVLDGRGVVVDPHTVEVDGRRYTAERILVATGGWPVLPDGPGKIGRASWRERVCQYGEISGVAVTVKKKIK